MYELTSNCVIIILYVSKGDYHSNINFIQIYYRNKNTPKLTHNSAVTSKIRACTCHKKIIVKIKTASAKTSQCIAEPK